jgi:hypothetical protein
MHLENREQSVNSTRTTEQTTRRRGVTVTVETCRHGVDYMRGARAAAVGSEGQPDEASLQALLAQSQYMAAAVESGLKAQRTQLQLQLEMAAQREALLEARLQCVP